MPKESPARKILLVVYFIIGLLPNIFYLLNVSYNFQHLNDTQSGITPPLANIIFSMLMAFTLILSFGLFLFTILFFHYRARNLFWLLFPFVGGLTFAGLAFFSKAEAQTYRMPKKLWGILVVFGLYGVDNLAQLPEAFFRADLHKMNLLQNMIIVLFLVGGIVYCIYWGRKRRLALWQFRPIWEHKWKILIGIVAITVFSYFWPWLLSLFHISIPQGANQDALNALERNIPAIVFWIEGAIAAPVMEESIFRVGIFELVSPKHPKLAILVSTVVFASAHMIGNITTWSLWPIYLAMGFVFGFLYYKTRRVEVSATAHFIWNGIMTYILPS